FLQRIVNGGGRIEREYGLGRLRTDLLILWFYGEDRTQRCVLELKILRGSLATVIKKGLEQTWQYLDRCGAEEGHLLIFDRGDKAWEKKLFRREETHRGKEITVWGIWWEDNAGFRAGPERGKAGTVHDSMILANPEY
ncbi:MAG: hypothetical protein GY862_31140, partial [Gammaproteobacteria bacterium]|nr:hypothetical protein [Gammaproteobacteria bacterium]